MSYLIKKISKKRARVRIHIFSRFSFFLCNMYMCVWVRTFTLKHCLAQWCAALRLRFGAKSLCTYTACARTRFATHCLRITAQTSFDTLAVHACCTLPFRNCKRVKRTDHRWQYKKINVVATALARLTSWLSRP